MEEKQVDLAEIERKFDAVIGYCDIKKELVRICDIMSNYSCYEKLGGKIPSGLLLSGVPGVGKTLMANCFISASGRKTFVCRKDKPQEEFIAHIKSVFEQAEKNAPSIVLLDDMDKFSNEDEYHKNSEEFITVQSCIDEVKGKGVFVLATINDSRAIPNSLLREGRFDSKITVESPRGKDAEKIVEHYLKDKRISQGASCKTIARLLDGASCAQLETVINEASLIAGFKRKEIIEMDDILSACLRIIYEAPKNSTPIGEQRRKRVAYHEAGHAVVAEVLLPGCVNFVTVRAHGRDKGGFVNICTDELDTETRSYADARTSISLAGKAVTEIMFGETDMGSSVDIDMAMDCQIKVIGNEIIGFKERRYDYNCGNDWREKAQSKVIFEVEKAYEKVKKIVANNREFIEKIASALMEKDTLIGEEVQKIKATCALVA